MYPKRATMTETLLLAVLFVLIWLLNFRAARRLQRRIDELDALEGQRYRA
jgi:Flp pilus assembly protein TadB